MQQEALFHVHNLEALIEAVESRPVEAIGLGSYTCGAGKRVTHCPAGLLALLPRFVALGVQVSTAQLAAPCMLGPAGEPFDVDATLNHLFGSFGACSAFNLLFAAAGAGVWDAVFTGGMSEPCNHRELALLRLYFAFEHLTRRSYRAEPTAHADVVCRIVHERLLERGWAARAGSAIAGKGYPTVVGAKDALAYFVHGDPFCFALSGCYWSEGDNILSTCGALIPRAACTNTVLKFVDQFVVDVDAAVADSYAVRLARLS